MQKRRNFFSYLKSVVFKNRKIKEVLNVFKNNYFLHIERVLMQSPHLEYYIFTVVEIILKCRGKCRNIHRKYKIAPNQFFKPFFILNLNTSSKSMLDYCLINYYRFFKC